MNSSSLRIVVTGLIAQHPFAGGLTWHYLQYVLGLARLGHEVYYVEDSGQWPYKRVGGAARRDWIAHDCSHNVDYLAGIMARFGLADRWAYFFALRPRWFGLSSKKRAEILSTADLLVNVSGTLRRPQDYRLVPRLAYVDTDPMFTQIKLNLARGQTKFRRRVDLHDVHFTFGERLAALPATGHNWHATRQPVVLSEWDPSTRRRDVFTTVTNWVSYRPLKHRGRSYAQKDVEFQRFIELPRKVNCTALEIASSETKWLEGQRVGRRLRPGGADVPPHLSIEGPSDLFARRGWRVVDAAQVCADLDGYRDYIQSSKAEWSVAKNGYVVGQPGWFSERSACYLAAGRPVVVQDTGFGAVLPVGEGILTFSCLPEAASAIREVRVDYPRHAGAARAIAEGYFDSDKVLPRLIDQALASHV